MDQMNNSAMALRHHSQINKDSKESRAMKIDKAKNMGPTKKYDLRREKTLNTLADIDLEQMEMEMNGEQHWRKVLETIQSLNYHYFMMMVTILYGLTQILIVIAEDKFEDTS